MLAYFFALPLLLTVAPFDGVTRKNFERIEFEMTKQQVVRILGRPPIANPTLADRFGTEAGAHYAGTLHSLITQSDGELWRSGTLKIFVLFDENQRVRGMMREGPCCQAVPQTDMQPAASTDYQKVADRQKWTWEPEKADLRYCCDIAFPKPDYKVDITILKEDFSADFDPFRENVIARILENGREVHVLKDYPETAFARRGDILYIAHFWPAMPGCAVEAFDFRAKKRLWLSRLKGVKVDFWSLYRNAVTIATSGNAIVVQGNEAAGRYVEYLDMASGKTVGHKVFRED